MYCFFLIFKYWPIFILIQSPVCEELWLHCGMLHFITNITIKKLYYHKLFASSYFHCWFANSSLPFQRIVTLEMSLQRRKRSNIRINRPWMWRMKTGISFKNILIKMMLLSMCDQHFKSVTDWWLYFLP